MRRIHLSFGVVAALVAMLGAFNWLFLEFLRRSEEFRTSPLYQTYHENRELALSPWFVIPDLAFVAALLWWVFARSRVGNTAPVSPWRLAVFAMALGNLCGLLLAWLVKL